MIDFAGSGLGLQYGTVQLVPADGRWAEIAERLAAAIKFALTGTVAAVEHVGSTAVPGLLAKPVVDLAIGLRPQAALEDVVRALAPIGWIYRGDAGDEGGWIFVMEDAPRHRVAHAHGVLFAGRQWQRYLQFRDLLRRSETARRTYADAKQLLAAKHPDGRRSRTRAAAGRPAGSTVPNIRRPAQCPPQPRLRKKCRRATNST